MPLIQLSTECQSRKDIPKMIQRMGLAGEGAEIGVREGIYAKAILTGWTSCTRLHLIDPWCKLPDDEYQDEREFDPEWEQTCRRRMNEFGDRVVFHKQRSMEVIDSFAQPSLAFVYVDGNHDRMHVNHDVWQWWKRLAPNGVLAGHDIFNIKCPGVTQAVLEFAKHAGRTVYIVPGDTDTNGKLVVDHSWYILKGDL